jgi:predicted cupin superfamily sugar epimerase
MTVPNICQKLIEYLHLQPLPMEGGYFYQTYRSKDEIPLEHLPKRYPSRRRFSSAIYYLMTEEPESFSAMHKLLSDEIYHFYLGDPVEMLLLFPDRSSKRIILGQDILGDQHVQYRVSHGTWQGSHLQAGGKFALLGTTMAPGYESDEFVLGRLPELAMKYPQEKEFIHQLIRNN